MHKRPKRAKAILSRKNNAETSQYLITSCSSEPSCCNQPGPGGIEDSEINLQPQSPSLWHGFQKHTPERIQSSQMVLGNLNAHMKTNENVSTCLILHQNQFKVNQRHQGRPGTLKLKNTAKNSS